MLPPEPVQYCSQHSCVVTRIVIIYFLTIHIYIYISLLYIYIYIYGEMVYFGESDKMIKISGKVNKLNPYKGFSRNISFFINGRTSSD